MERGVRGTEVGLLESGSARTAGERLFWKTTPVGDAEEMFNSRTITAIIFNKNINLKTLIK